MTVRWPILPAATLVLLGCALDFVEPDAATTPPRLDLRVALEREAGADAAVRVAARLDVGVDDDGPRAVVRDTLRLLGATLTPLAGIGRVDGLHYDSTWVAPALASEPAMVAVTTPVVEGFHPIADRPVGYTLAPDGPDTVVVRRGEEAMLPLRRPPAADGLDLDPERSRWSLFATGDGAEVWMRVRIQGEPPDTLAVPTSWLPSGFEGDVTVDFRTDVDFTSEPSAGEVELRASSITRLRWTVRVVAPAVATDLPRAAP